MCSAALVVYLGLSLVLLYLVASCQIHRVQLTIPQRKLALAFRGVTVDAVKDDNHLRRETKKSIDEVIRSLPSLDM